MKMNIQQNIRLLVWLLILPIFASSALAQSSSGNIKGQVIDRDGSPLPGASVTIKGTTRTVATDLQGNFEILDVKDGTYTLQINYMGYKPSDGEVTVRSGQTIFKGFTLQLNSKNLSAVTVSAVMEGQQKALNQQKIADNIKQVISADLMGRYPDLNVAESMQRLPGVTIQRNSSGEGSTIQLRGTPPNFTNILVNGEQIMSTQENGQRSVSLDVIPVGILSSMEVSKTLTPDQDGDAIAGTVNLKSPTASSLKPRLTADLGGGYNHLRDHANIISNLSVGKRFLANDLNPNGRLGIQLAGSLYKTRNGYDELDAQVWQQNNFNDNKGSIYFPTDVRYLYVENNRTRKGGSATVDYSFSPTTKLVANVMYSDNYNDFVRYRKRTRMQIANTTVNADGVYSTKKGRAYNEVKSEQDDNSNLTFNLDGETVIGKVKLEGGIYMGKAEFQEHTGTYNFITGNIPLSTSAITGDDLMATGTDWRNNASLFGYNTVEHEHYHDVGRNFVTKLNMSFPYKIGKNSAIFKAGYKTKFTHNRRDYPDQVIISTYGGDAAAGSLNNFKGLSDVSSRLLDNTFDFGLGVDKDKTIDFFNSRQGTADFPMDSSSIRNTIDTYYYDATENIVAGYLMNRIQFDRWMLLTGLRIENTQVDYKGNIVQQDANGFWVSTTLNRSKNNYTKFLPNIQAKYDINRSTDVRGGLTFGYSRPDFAQLIPGRIISVLAETIVDGNPALKPAFATNGDLMIEKYLSNLGILSAGAFYKSIDKFQYNSVTVLQGNEFENANLYQGWQWFRTLNGNTATVFGLELNAQANLTFLPGILKGFSILGNYTYAHSKADAQFRKDIRLPGQATSTANGSLAFNYKGLTLQGNVNYNGSYIVSLGADANTDVIQNARIQVDANGSYRINKRWTVYLEGQNLTNSPTIDYYGVRSRVYMRQYYSWWGRAGVKFRL
ncbi:MAG TPA: TonB-dependent receptor [Puia sp.]|jgi:TonB-dependent receptor